MDDHRNQSVQECHPGSTSRQGNKSEHIRKLMADCQGNASDPHFVAFFRCFNAGQYFEAHEVLEELWLADRRGPIGDFYKGLIQLAGAMVHLGKNRLPPGLALLKLARANLEKYPLNTQEWPVGDGISLINEWLNYLSENNLRSNPLNVLGPPKLPRPE